MPFHSPGWSCPRVTEWKWVQGLQGVGVIIPNLKHKWANYVGGGELG